MSEDDRKRKEAEEKKKSDSNGKDVRFNEKNIDETYHPEGKDYGHDKIAEAKTPFPRHADPIDPDELSKRLQDLEQDPESDCGDSDINIADIDGDCAPDGGGGAGGAKLVFID